MNNILFIDIETVSQFADFSELPDRFKPLWTKKADLISKDPEIDVSDLYKERAGIYSEFGKIIVIGMGFLMGNEKDGFGIRTKALKGDDEKELLIEFNKIVSKLNPAETVLVAHNGKEFDFPYIARRMLIQGVELPSILDNSGKKPWEIQHQDTMEMWKFGDWKSYTSLDLLSAVFNIPSSKSDIDGSMVSHVYHSEKDLNKISEYCIRDVIVCAQVYLKMKGKAIIDESNITSVP